MSPDGVPRIAACMIVKDAAETIEKCLDAIRPHVDGIFVYDTGSTDDTLEILDRLGKTLVFKLDKLGDEPREVPLAPITVKKGEWRDDFSWARQQSWEMPGDKYDWLIWLDDDDIVEGAHNLRHLTSSAEPFIDGFVFYYDYARDENGGTVCQLWRERLIRRDRNFRWAGVVHEVLIPPDGHPPNFRLVPREAAFYRHERPVDRYDPARNLKLLEAEAAKCEQEGIEPDPRTLAYLGTEHMAKANWAAAAPWLERYLSHPQAGWTDERMQVCHKLAACLRYLGHIKASIECETRAVQERCDWAENYVGLAQSHAVLEQWQHVELYARRAVDLGMPNSLLILNPLEFTFVPYVLLADACAAMGKHGEALEWMRKAAELVPSDQVRGKLADMAERGLDAQIISQVLSLRETLVRFDENQKAYQLMENVPYRIAEDPRIVKARSDQREMVAHMLRPDEYRRWYRDEPKESTVPDEYVENIDQWLDRARLLLEGLQEQEQELGRKPVALDLGCNDFWLACFLWRKHGIHMDGVELNQASVEKALGRKERFGAPGDVWQGDLHDAPTLTGRKYDAVSLFEVLEHTPDVTATLRVCEQLLAPGGRVYLTTPNGAYERGNIQEWSRVERKGHLRAITTADLSRILNSRGEVVQVAPHGPRGDDLTFAAYTPRRKKSRITFYAGGSPETWSPASINQGGIGGSETALTQVAVRLAQAGHEVTVYAQCEPGLYAGSLWRPFTAWDPREETDLLVVSRLPHVFENPLGARRTALWCHDHSYVNLTEKQAELMDTVVTLTDWHRDRFASLYPYLEGKLAVIRNGISYWDGNGQPNFPHGDRPFAERRPVCVYSSSADRGLDCLLQFWPDIRQRVPDAELHIFYGWETFDRYAIAAPHLLEFKQHVYQLADQAGGENGGVFFRGRVGQADLYDEFQLARVWTYPTYFMETSCITAMETRAAGLPSVTSQLAALTETVGRSGRLFKPQETDRRDVYAVTRDQYGKGFVRETVRLLTDEAYWSLWHTRARKNVEGFDWSRRVKDWERLIPAARTARRKVAA